MKISLQRLLEEVNRDILGDRIREGDWGKFWNGRKLREGVLRGMSVSPYFWQMSHEPIPHAS
jgi:hypothetical protein